MNTGNDAVEFIRTLVTGDLDANDWYERQLESQGWQGFPALLNAVFFLAVDRRFEGQLDPDQVRAFTDGLMAQADPDAVGFTEAEARSLISAMLDPTVPYTLTPEKIGTIQILVSHRILTDEALDGPELDEFLDEAVELAGRDGRWVDTPKS